MKRSNQSSTTNSKEKEREIPQKIQKITNFFQTSQKQKPKLEWKKINSILYLKSTSSKDLQKDQLPPENQETSEIKIAAFDLDATLYKPKSTFPKHHSDWKLVHQSIPQTLTSLSLTHKIVIFSNQLNINKNVKNYEIFKARVEGLSNLLDLNFDAFFATERDEFRKPQIGMFEYYLNSLNSGVKSGVNGLDGLEMFYVGDAAGRRGDHNDTDYKFALNAGIKFYTPEEYFNYGNNVKPRLKFDYTKYLSSKKESGDCKEVNKYHSEEDEIIVFFGGPFVGKTVFYEKYLKPFGYQLLSNDLNNLSNVSCGKFVIDARNPTEQERKTFLNILKEYKGKVKCFKFNDDVNFLKHVCYYHHKKNNLKVNLKETEKFIRSYKSVSKEGFDEIVSVEFRAEFEKEEDKRAFCFYYF